MMMSGRTKAVAAVAVAGMGLGAAIAFAQPGGMGQAGIGPDPMAVAQESAPLHEPIGRMGGKRGMGGMGHQGGMAFDAAAPADMRVVRQMILSHEKIERSVTNLPNGIRTVIESSDPQVSQAIQAHVASMDGRLADSRVFNRFSENLPVLFDAKDKLKSEIEMTERGAIVTQTSDDPKVVAALQAHAQEVSDLARDGRAGMMRAAMAARGR